MNCHSVKSLTLTTLVGVRRIILSSRLVFVVALAIAVSAETLAKEPSLQNVSYVGASEANGSRATSLDIYCPKQPGSYPVVIWVHGGAWILDDKRNVDHKPEAFNNHSFVLVSINYRMHPRVDFRGMASDIAAAVHWTKDNIAKHSGDPRQLFLMGHSAGAHLCALVVTDPGYLRKEGLSSADIHGIVLLDGLAYNVPRDMQRVTGAMKLVYKKIFTSDPETQTAGSPQLHVTRDATMPVWVIVYLENSQTTAEQSVEFAAAILAAGGTVSAIGVTGTSHMGLNRKFGLPGTPGTQQVFEFLNKHSKHSDTITGVPILKSGE